MKRRPFIVSSILAIVMVLGIAGCSRTTDDIAKWKAEGNIEKLIKALDDPKVDVRQLAAVALGELKAEPAVNALAARFNDSEDRVILAAVDALGAIGSQSVITPLVAALKLKLPPARISATVALGELKATSAVEPLGKLLDDSEKAVQLAAAGSIGQIGDEKGTGALAGKLNDSSVNLRIACVEALGSTGGKPAAEALIGALTDKHTGVTKAAVKSLVKLGETSIPYALTALKNEQKKIRIGAIATLRGLKSVPGKGADLIWYQLARVSVDQQEGINKNVVKTLAKQGESAIDALLEAAAHAIPDFREHAFLAMEIIGEPCLKKALKASKAHAGPDGKTWFEGRTTWNGAPSWRLNLWGAVTSLSPEFNLSNTTVENLQSQGRIAFNVIISPDFKPTREYIPLLIALLGDRTTPPPAQPDYDADGIPVVKKARDTFRGEANQLMTKEMLMASIQASAFPLIAAIGDQDELLAGHAAEILGELNEKRALRPLMKVVSQKIAQGQRLTTSPFYNALQKMDDPVAEPLLLKIRPSPDRAIRVFERNYANVRAMSAETEGANDNPHKPIKFHIGYTDNGHVGELMVPFAKDGFGNWIPTPSLPDQLP